jgi:hypothetical protein
MSNQSKTLIFTNLIFTNCGIPIGDDILTKLLARQCLKHGKIEYCNVIGAKKIGFVKFNNLDDAIFVKNFLNNQILFKSIVKIQFSNDEPIKTLRFSNPLSEKIEDFQTEQIKTLRVFNPSSEKIEDFQNQQRDRISKMLEELL